MGQPDARGISSAEGSLSAATAEKQAEAATPDKPADAAQQPDTAETFSVLDITTGTVETISVRDYLIGSVCAEMPATFEPEALKAQAVAAHTYAVRQRLLEQQNQRRIYAVQIFPTTAAGIRHILRRIRRSNTTEKILTGIMRRLQQQSMQSTPICWNIRMNRLLRRFVPCPPENGKCRKCLGQCRGISGCSGQCRR